MKKTTHNSGVLSMCLCAVAFLLLSAGSLSAQSHRVTGKVVDENNEPLAGVAVFVEGATSGEITTTDGTYSIMAKKGSVLVFSSLGYSEEREAVADCQTINVKMRTESFGLDETIVVGYGTQSRRTITAAVAKVGGEVMINNPITSMGEALKGRVSGARVYTSNFSPGEDPTIHIRGGSSINGSNSPLILVDGIERPMAGLNPNDIESIEVLKDAASTAIYGSRGSNGIVLITTKKGDTEGRPRITFEATVGVQGPERKFDLMNAEDYLSYVRPAMQFSPSKQYLWTDNSSASGFNSNTSVYTTRYLNEGEQIPAGWKSMQDPLDPSKTLIFEDNDWQKQMFRTTIWQNYYVGLTGGTQKTKYIASIGYTDDNGVALGTGYQRFVGKIGVTSTITEKLVFRANADYSDTQNQYFPNQMNQISRAISAAPTMRLHFEDGTPAYGYNATSMSPLYYDYVTDRHSRYNRVALLGGLTWYIIDGLKADVQASYYYQGRQLGSFQRANYFTSARATMEQYVSLYRKKVEAYLDYTKTFNRHSISALAGYSYMGQQDFNFQATAEGASSDKVQTLTAGPTKTGATSSISRETLMGYFARVNYDFAKKYLVSLSFRADASSRFAKGNKWGFFPAASAGWILSEEEWMKGAANTLSFFKFKASYGQTGNNAIGLYDALGSYAVNKYNGVAGMYPSGMPNEALTWETTTQLDAGFEFGLFNNRIFFTGDYFNKVTDDLLFSVSLPNTSGFSSVKTNVGSVLFHGFDLELSTKNIVRKNFTWESKFTWSFVKNRVLKLPENGRVANRIGGITLGKSGEEFGGTAEGESLYGLYGFIVDHIIQSDEEAANALYDSYAVGYDPITGVSTKGRKFAGDYEWVNREGSSTITINGVEQEQINSEDRFLLGYSVPHSTGGFGNTFHMGNFTVNLYLDWALGHTIMHAQEARQFINTFTCNTAISEKVKDCWTPQNPDAKYARFQVDGPLQSQNFKNNSDVFAYKGDYLCIREFSVSYRLPQSVLSKLRMKDASVVLAGNNLHYFTAVPGVAPEVGASSTNAADYSNYPPSRRVSLGLKVTF